MKPSDAAWFASSMSGSTTYRAANVRGDRGDATLLLRSSGCVAWTFHTLCQYAVTYQDIRPLRRISGQAGCAEGFGTRRSFISSR
eukprot:2194857-Rhodomonas_salina.1